MILGTWHWAAASAQPASRSALPAWSKRCTASAMAPRVRQAMPAVQWAKPCTSCVWAGPSPANGSAASPSAARTASAGSLLQAA